MIKMLVWQDWLRGMGYVRLTDKDGYYGPGSPFVDSDVVAKQYKNYRIAILENRKKARKIKKETP